MHTLSKINSNYFCAFANQDKYLIRLKKIINPTWNWLDFVFYGLSKGYETILWQEMQSPLFSIIIFSY